MTDPTPEPTEAEIRAVGLTPARMTHCTVCGKPAYRNDSGEPFHYGAGTLADHAAVVTDPTPDEATAARS